MTRYAFRCLAVLAAVLTLASAARAADFINVLTGGTSGVYYPMGVALSQIYGKAMPDAKASDERPWGSCSNARSRPRRSATNHTRNSAATTTRKYVTISCVRLPLSA